MAMSNLNNIMFYKVKFSVKSINPDDDLLWRIILHIKNWQTRKCSKRGLKLTPTIQEWTRFKLGNKIVADDNTVYFFSEYFSPNSAKEQYWACRIIENLSPQDGYANRRWITEIGYEQTDKNSAVLSCVVSYSDRAGFIGPYMDNPPPSIPNLILNIIDDINLHTFCGNDNLQRIPNRLAVGDWPLFYNKIMDKERQLPYILISPQLINSNIQELTYLVKPLLLTQTLLGNAIVFYSDNPDFFSEIRYMNENYACYGGAIRVYQPNETDANKNRYLSASDIQDYGEEQIVCFLFRAFAQNVNFYDSFFCLEECKRKKEEYIRKERLAYLHNSHKAEIEKVENDYFKIALDEEEKRLQAESVIDDLQKQLGEGKNRIFNLESQLEQLKFAAEENNKLHRSLDARFEIYSIPSTIDDIVLYFKSMFADRIIFSDIALKSIKGCTIELSDIWNIFFSLANVMWDLYKNQNGNIFAIFHNKTGIEASRGEGRMTRKDKVLMRQFEIELDGEIIDVEAHITYPKLKQSIHFGYSTKKQKIVLGHCGEHLDNYTTRKIK